MVGGGLVLVWLVVVESGLSFRRMVNANRERLGGISHGEILVKYHFEGEGAKQSFRLFAGSQVLCHLITRFSS